MPHHHSVALLVDPLPHRPSEALQVQVDPVHRLLEALQVPQEEVHSLSQEVRHSLRQEAEVRLLVLPSLVVVRVEVLGHLIPSKLILWLHQGSIRSIQCWVSLSIQLFTYNLITMQQSFDRGRALPNVALPICSNMQVKMFKQ